MQNCGVSSNVDRQPVLPLADLLSHKNVEQVALLPVGTKIKSFKINNFNSGNSPHAGSVNRTRNIKLPNFDSLQSDLLNANTHQVETKTFNLPFQSQCNLRTIKRFWLHWLLSLSEKIPILILLILFQSSSQASNLLEKAKIYIDLNSSEATNLPASSEVYLNDSQASLFNQAIAQAREIEEDSPFYLQAQNNINRWSEVILDIAKGRAIEGDFAGAIAAAKLIPQNHFSTKSIAREATIAVKDWQLRTREDNRDYLAEAKKSIDPEQASSYSQAIAILQQIPPGVKEYQSARELINLWNEKIYLIAERRAAKGKFQAAVEAALLVSPDSIYYLLAKDLIEQKIKCTYAQYME